MRASAVAAIVFSLSVGCAAVWGFGDATIGPLETSEAGTDGAISPDGADAPPEACDGRPCTNFVKYGNAFTVSCDEFCGRTVWGPVGTCVSAQAFNVPCTHVTGALEGGGELLCICDDAEGKYEKRGNDGSVSCAAFCADATKGPVGPCRMGVAEKVACSQAIGALPDGTSLSCTCRGAVSCSQTPCPTPAGGATACAGGKCNVACADGYIPCASGCCPRPPAFRKHGNNGTVSCTTYCAGPNWAGKSGTCSSARALDIPCGRATGYFSNLSSLLCTCSDRGVFFDKPGNDGSASCDGFCAGPQWGRTGVCVHAAALDVPCGDTLDTGALPNASDVQCSCQ